MPRKPNPKPHPDYNPRVNLTLAPETIERIARLRAARPELRSMGAAIDWACRIAEDAAGTSRRDTR